MCTNLSLLSDVPLSHYEYVQECRKFDRDVKLIMLLENEVDCSLARTVSNPQQKHELKGRVT